MQPVRHGLDLFLLQRGIPTAPQIQVPVHVPIAVGLAVGEYRGLEDVVGAKEFVSCGAGDELLIRGRLDPDVGVARVENLARRGIDNVDADQSVLELGDRHEFVNLAGEIGMSQRRGAGGEDLRHDDSLSERPAASCHG